MNQPFNLLAFEAATQVCSVALYVNGQTFSRFQKTPKRSSDVLLVMINELLIEAGISINQLNAIAVGYGPGSFMGVRLTVGVAQGLAFPYDIPLIGVSTLQILAQTVFQASKSKFVLTAWDARMHEMYYGAYRLNDAGIMSPTQKDQLISPHQFAFPKENYTLAGNAWSVYYDDFSNEFKHQFNKSAADDAWIYPHAESLVSVAKDQYQHKKYTCALDLSPVYLRNKVA